MTNQYHLLTPSMRARFEEKRDARKCLIGALVFLCGASLIYLSSFVPSKNDSILLATFLTGLAVCIYGVSKIVFGSKTLTDSKTGAKVETRDIYFSAKDKTAVMNAINNGNWNALGGESLSSTTSPVRLCTWYTNNGQYASAMLMEYVPYEYVPVTQVKEIPDELRDKFIKYVKSR
ncbi:MAG: hypothetical protein SOY07_10075 [Bacteroidales bacterium]|nr:hypothetical protein [Bacteroidales bacterium]MDY4175620.1 hypothetical protein [Bacteroidales bacterium]